MRFMEVALKRTLCVLPWYRADRACCADTTGLQQGEGESERHDRYGTSGTALHCFYSRAVGFGGLQSRVWPDLAGSSLVR